MIGQVRAAHQVVSVNGQDYSVQLEPYFLELSYKDSVSGDKADDIQLKLADPDRRWITDWMPEKGAKIDVAIRCERWFSPNAAPLLLDCGSFYIDQVEFSLPEHTLSIKANPIPPSAKVKGTKKTKGFESTNLKAIAEKMAADGGMTVQYESSVNPIYKRVDQTEESDLEFLKKRTGDASLKMKISRDKIVVFDEADYEKRPPKFILAYGDQAPSRNDIPCYRLRSAKFTTKLTDTAKECCCSYMNPETGRLTKETFTANDRDVIDDTINLCENPDYELDEPRDGGDGEAFVLAYAASVREGADPVISDWTPPSAAPSKNKGKGAKGKKAAMRKAKGKLREKNKEKQKGEKMSLGIGNPLVAAGQTFLLEGCGQFDAKYFIEEVTHKLGTEDYNTELTARKVLEGY
jgi:phage protein D